MENICVHSRNGYFNGHIFHRVIKGFMIQTGDPKGKKHSPTINFVLKIGTLYTLNLSISCLQAMVLEGSLSGAESLRMRSIPH